MPETKPSNSTEIEEPFALPLKQRSGRTLAVAVSRVMPVDEGTNIGFGASTTAPLQTNVEAAIILGMSSVPGRGAGNANASEPRHINKARERHRFVCMCNILT